jgi:hypothetical protein
MILLLVEIIYLNRHFIQLVVMVKVSNLIFHFKKDCN